MGSTERDDTIFCRLPTLNLPEDVTEADLKLLENFVVLLYSKNWQHS